MRILNALAGHCSLSAGCLALAAPIAAPTLAGPPSPSPYPLPLREERIG